MAPAKPKTQKMSLGDFLGDQSLGSWADEMEDAPISRGDGRAGYGERRAFSSTGSFGGDRAMERAMDRGFAVREQLPLPDKPPFTAHLGNLSYDVTEGDVNDFFDGCAVTHVRIIEDKLERKPKGFGYVEFGTLEGLKKALDLSGSQLQGRNVKVTVAEPAKDRPDRPEARVIDDWTRKGPLADLPSQNTRRASDRGGGFNNRNFDNQSDAGSERGGERRRPPFEGDGKSRDFSNWERKGPLSPAATGPPREAGRGRGQEGAPRTERRQSPSWGENRSQDGGQRPARTFERAPPPPERQPTQAEMDSQWRARMRPDQPAKSPESTPDTSTPSSPATKAAAPAGRPKLNLQKRTISEAVQTPTSASADAKASPFGAARPVDTATKESEVADRKDRERKDQEDKIKEEKRRRDEAAKAEKEKAKAAANEAKTGGDEDEEAINGSDAPSQDEKENGAVTPKPGFEILQRVNDENEGNDQEADANSNAKQEKEAKPRGNTRDLPVRKGSDQGTWRRGSGQKQPPSKKNDGQQPKELDSDGWSTVPKSTRGRGRGNARPVAS